MFCARAMQEVGYFGPVLPNGQVTTVFPYTGLLRVLLSPKTQIMGEGGAPCAHRASFLSREFTCHHCSALLLPGEVLCCEACTPFHPTCPEDCIVHAVPWSIAQQHNVIVLGLCWYPCLLQPQQCSCSGPLATPL